MIVYTISFTEKGDLLNKKFTDIFQNYSVYCSFKGQIKNGLKEWTKNAFSQADIIIFIGATGIVTRAIAPFITKKDVDPAVIVCDELANFVIPILSGHIGRANEFATFIAKKLSAIPVITTATDINNVFAIDTWAVSKNLKISNIENIKFISAALLEGKKVGFLSDFEITDKTIISENFAIGDTSCECGVVISPYLKNVFKHTLNLVPKCLFIGVGSKKNADENALIEIFQKICNEKNIDKYSILGVSTIDLKQNEKSVLNLCNYLDIPLKFYNKDELNNVYGDFTKSEFVKKITGTDNVCERSAYISSQYGDFQIKKTTENGVTIAFCRKEVQI